MVSPDRSVGRGGLHRSLVPGLPDPSAGMAADGLQVQVCPARTHWALRGARAPLALAGAASDVPGLLPLRPNTFRTLGEADGRLASFDPSRALCNRWRDYGRTVWLSPDEWLVMLRSTALDAHSPAGRLAAVLAEKQVPRVDLSAGQVVLEVAGRQSGDLLATGCPLDLDVTVFPAGSCAQSLFGKCPVTILCLESADSFEIVVRNSFAPYLWERMARTLRLAQ